jgi:hypothetical protein
MSLPPNSVLVIDRGYIDFKLLNQWSQENIFFVTMIKDSIKYTTVEEKPLPESKWENILKDEIIELSGLETKQSYPEKLRRVVVYDEKQNRTIELLTNNFNWTAETISELYKQRWQIEIFFKQLKNHLKIKSFIGTNQNAIWIQIWTALISLLIVKFLKEIAKYPWSLSNLIAFLRMNLFNKISLDEWLHHPFEPKENFELENLQLNLI